MVRIPRRKNAVEKKGGVYTVTTEDGGVITFGKVSDMVKAGYENDGFRPDDWLIIDMVEVYAVGSFDEAVAAVEYDILDYASIMDDMADNPATNDTDFEAYREEARRYREFAVAVRATLEGFKC